MLKKWLLTLLACLVIAGVLVVYKVMDNRAAEQINAAAPEYSETVEVANVELMDYQPAVSVLGQVVAPQQVSLRNEVAGTIAEVNFASGALVKKGQLLIQLDISEERAQLQSAVARAELALTTKKRISQLRASKAVSQDQLDRTVAELKVAEADKAIIQANISKKTLQAPFDAIAGLHQFERGQYLEENSLITTLVGLQDFVWVDFSLPQIYAVLPSAARVTIAPLSSANAGSLDAAAWAPLSATVVARESVMTRESRSLHYRVRVEQAQLDKSKTSLLANAIVRVKVPIAPPQTKLAVPAVAVLHSSAGPYVYVLNDAPEVNTAMTAQPAYRANRQSVTLGEQQGDFIIVESGLAAGQRIASAGAFKLSPGLLTFLNNPPETANQSDAASQNNSSEASATQEAL